MIPTSQLEKLQQKAVVHSDPVIKNKLDLALGERPIGDSLGIAA